MSPKLRLLVFAVGALVLALLVERVGVRALARDARQVGWYIVPMVLVYLPVYLLNATAWRMTMTGARQRPSYLRMLGYTISGFALNYLTPVIALGGEAYRAASVSEWLGRRRAVASVASYYLLHALANLLVWLTALLVAMAIAPWPTPVRWIAAAVALVLAGIVAVVFYGLRRGVFEALLGTGMRVPLLRRALRKAGARRAAFARVDAHMTAFYVSGPRRFFGALAIEYVARAVSMAEFWFIFLGLGLEAGYLHAFTMGALTSLAMNVVFFVPLELGTKEGALFLIAAALGLSASVGLLSSLISRVREIAWAIIGLALVPLLGRATGAARRRVRAAR